MPAGTTRLEFTIYTKTVLVDTTATIDASDGSSSTEGKLLITADGINWVSINDYPDPSVRGGKSTGALLEMLGPAPAGGLTVHLSSDSPLISVPATIVVPAGSFWGNFEINAAYTDCNISAHVTASVNGSSRSDGLTIIADPPQSLSTPASAAGGTSVQATVTMAAAAPTGGVAVSLYSFSAAVSVPSSVTIPAGDSSATFKVTTSPVTSTTHATIAASLAGGSVSSTMVIYPAAMQDASSSPRSVQRMTRVADPLLGELSYAVDPQSIEDL
jgi:hypothetical protein